MAAPSFFVRSLLRVAKLQGRAVLEAIVTGQFVYIQNGGRRMIRTKVEGKEFDYNFPPNLQLDAVMGYVEAALEQWDGMAAEDTAAGNAVNTTVNLILSTRPITATRAGFKSQPGSYL